MQAKMYLDYYGKKENQDMVTKEIKDYSQYLLEKQKYKFNQKKNQLLIDINMKSINFLED